MRSQLAEDYLVLRETHIAHSLVMCNVTLGPWGERKGRLLTSGAQWNFLRDKIWQGEEALYTYRRTVCFKSVQQQADVGVLLPYFRGGGPFAST